MHVPLWFIALLFQHNSAKMKKKVWQTSCQESTQPYTTMQLFTQKNLSGKKKPGKLHATVEHTIVYHYAILFPKKMSKKNPCQQRVESFTLMWNLCRAEEDSRLIQVCTVLGTTWEARLIRFLIREFLRRLATGLQKRQCWHKGWEDEEAICFSHLLKSLYSPFKHSHIMYIYSTGTYFGNKVLWIHNLKLIFPEYTQYLQVILN